MGSISVNTVHNLSSDEKRRNQGSNPGLLGEKHERYLCAILPLTDKYLVTVGITALQKKKSFLFIQGQVTVSSNRRYEHDRGGGGQVVGRVSVGSRGLGLNSCSLQTFFSCLSKICLVSGHPENNGG